MKVPVLGLDGDASGKIELPPVFLTPFRKDLIHKAFTNLNSHGFQPQGRHPTAGMDVVARSNDPPTGRAQSRIAKMRGGGGGRQGQAGGVASVRGGRQAHPPNVYKTIYKKLNKKENKLALCSAIAATANKELVESRGHKTGKLTLPLIVSNDIESISNAAELKETLESLDLMNDIKRLEARKPRTGKSALRGRSKKVGKSVLFVAKNPENLKKACGAFLGVEAKSARELSVLDLAPGSVPIRLVVYSKTAIGEIANIQSTHLEIMVKIN